MDRRRRPRRPRDPRRRGRRAPRHRRGRARRARQRAAGRGPVRCPRPTRTARRPLAARADR
ncbi:MAG: hypothetical protein GEV00_04045 [Actinophytocola sp.]|nr:hypothetical protein [Actinophytocola sp.]